MFSIRCAVGPIEYRDNPPEWLAVIWKSNEVWEERGLDPDRFFGQPSAIEPWWAGGTVEEYEHARVLHREDPSVSIIAKTDLGEEILREAAKRLDIHVN